MKRKYLDYGTEVELDLTSQKLFIECETSTSDIFAGEIDERMLETTKVGEGEGSFEVRAIKTDLVLEEALKPKITLSRRSQAFCSITLFALKAKAVDDEIYKRVETLLQDGAKGKQALLKQFAEHLIDALPGKKDKAWLEATAITQAGYELGGGNPLPSSSDISLRRLKLQVKKLREEFFQDPFISTPVGIYSQGKELNSIFHQDRFLQNKLPEGVAPIFSSILESQATLARRYSSIIQVVSRLSNDYVNKHLLESDHDLRFFPASRAHETELMKELYADKTIPKDFNLIETFIEKIQTGEWNIEPKPESGWYDYQTFALAPLITMEKCQEADKVTWGEKYKQFMRDVFMSLLAATRETHIKQLESVAGGCAATPVVISPRLSVEPLPEYYLRRAQSYSFILKSLREHFEDEILNTHGIIEDCLKMENIFYGAYLTSCKEIGLNESSALSDREQLMAKSELHNWTEQLADDKDMQRDVRCMVPLFYDLEREKTKVLAILGIAEQPIIIDYLDRPSVMLTESSGDASSQRAIQWNTQRTNSHKLETCEVYVDKLLPREEFQALCDKYLTKTAIIDALNK